MGYSDEQKRASVEKARRLLQELDRSDALTEAAYGSDELTVASEDAPAVPWGQKNLKPYGLSYDPHSGRLERWKAEADEATRQRELARAQLREDERQSRELRARSSADWNSWFEHRFNELHEAEVFTETQREVLGTTLGRMLGREGVRGELEKRCAKLEAELGELRAQLKVADSTRERDGPVIDLVPSPVLRRHGSQR